MISPPFFAGIDVGSSHTKAVILNCQAEPVGFGIRKSGTDFNARAEACLQDALEKIPLESRDIRKIIATGYGRKNVVFSHDAKTEISCHAKGCYYHYPMAMTVIDIGGQDNKIMKIDSKGRRLDFKMNRKCAAGTGVFLEEIARRLELPLSDLDGLARRSQNRVALGSYCTVFSGTEVLEKIRQGLKVPDIVKGLFLSIIKRILEMDALEPPVVLTGGVVAHNPILANMLEAINGHEIFVPQNPQFTGALGAALFAME
jgi:predicted CoA-substrate-specific enzyme activase